MKILKRYIVLLGLMFGSCDDVFELRQFVDDVDLTYVNAPYTTVFISPESSVQMAVITRTARFDARFTGADGQQDISVSDALISGATITLTNTQTDVNIAFVEALLPGSESGPYVSNTSIDEGATYTLAVEIGTTNITGKTTIVTPPTDVKLLDIVPFQGAEGSYTVEIEWLDHPRPNLSLIHI